MTDQGRVILILHGDIERHPRELSDTMESAQRKEGRSASGMASKEAKLVS